MQGLGWTYTSIALGAAVQLVYTTVMARLLQPSDFGLVALGMLFVQAGQLVSELGLGRALVQQPSISAATVRAAFTAAVALGLAFFAVTWVGAESVAGFFGYAELAAVIQVLAALFIIVGLQTTAVSLLRRTLRFRALAVIETTSSAIAFVGVGIPLALAGIGVWSLVWGTLVRASIVTVAAYAIVRHPLRPTLNFANHLPLLRFGSQVSAISVLEYVGDTADRFVIGRFMNPIALGEYERAQTLSNLVMSRLAAGATRVLLPVLSTIQSDTARVRRALLNTQRLAAIAIVPTSAFLASTSFDIVHVALGAQWTNAVPAFSILALAAGASFLSSIPAVLLEATAALRPKLLIQLLFLVVLITLLVFTHQHGVVAVAVSVLVAQVVRHSAYLLTLSRRLGISLRVLLDLYVPALALGAAVFAGSKAIGLLAERAGWSSIVALAVCTLAALSCAAIMLIGPLRQVSTEVIEQSGIAGRPEGLRRFGTKRTR